MRTQATIQTK